MASEPKLYAVFGPNGTRYRIARKENDAWRHAWVFTTTELRRAKRAGYTCREVKIVPVDEVDTDSMYAENGTDCPCYSRKESDDGK